MRLSVFLNKIWYRSYIYMYIYELNNFIITIIFIILNSAEVNDINYQKIPI